MAGVARNRRRRWVGKGITWIVTPRQHHAAGGLDMAFRPVKINLINRCYATRLRAHPHQDHRPARWRGLPGMSGLPSDLRGRRPRSREGRGRGRVAAPAFARANTCGFARPPALAWERRLPEKSQQAAVVVGPKPESW